VDRSPGRIRRAAASAPLTTIDEAGRSAPAAIPTTTSLAVVVAWGRFGPESFSG
jgi:hypothetical protein